MKIKKLFGKKSEADATVELEAEGSNAVATDSGEAGSLNGQRVKKAKKAKKTKRLKNQALLKKGSYSLTITAVFIAGVILLNVLVGVLSDRFVLEFDMSTEKNNSISEENLEYIKNVEDDIEIIFCAEPEDYAENGYMAYYAQQYNVTENAADYYRQTITLVDKYADYNKKLKVTYMDTQSSEFSAVASEYSSDSLSYGDIIVSCEKNGKKRSKIVGYEDIYYLSEDSTYAAYGYTSATVAGNNIETALTSAIVYVTSSETKTVAMLTGHSSADYTEAYKELLEANNYTVETVSDALVTSIPDTYDAIVIAAPNSDFIGSELDAVSAFLDNDGKLDKGLIFFGSTSSPYLTNLYDFLSQWGISVDDGVLFETNDNNHMVDDPFTMGFYSSGNDEITDDVTLCITSANVPITTAFESQDGITVTSLIDSLESVVAAPKDTKSDWSGAGDYTQQSYCGLVQAVKEDYDDDNNLIASYVMAFSSTDFINSVYNEQSNVSNKNVLLAAAERAAGAEDTGISFISKTITDESFADSVSQGSANAIMLIFMLIIPLGILAVGIVVYIRRRNA